MCFGHRLEDKGACRGTPAVGRDGSHRCGARVRVGDDARVEARLERLYARLGRRYVPLLVGGMVAGGVLMCAATVAAGAAYLDAALRPALRVFAVMGAQTL